MIRPQTATISFFTICQFLFVLLHPITGKKDSLLIPLGSSKKANCECGKITKKIEDVRLAKVKVSGGSVPWLAEVVTNNEEGDTSSPWNVDEEHRPCFGTVVSLSSVLFPASCIDRTAKSKPRVRLLGVNTRKEEVRQVVSVRIHPGYRNKYDNDIALVRLKSPIDFNSTGVVPACFPQSQQRRFYDLDMEEGEEWREIEDDDDDDVNDGYGRREVDSEDLKQSPCRNPWPPCQKRPCQCQTKGTTPRPVPLGLKETFAIENVAIRTWIYRKSPGYPNVQQFGQFKIVKANSSRCSQLFPEMLQSKLDCVQFKDIKEISRQNSNFFKQLELGMPLTISNTTMVKGKPKGTKYILSGMRSPGHDRLPALSTRDSVIPVLKINDYIPWIKANSNSGHFCKT